uniref:Myotubularin phosphatase domain-containing protein n=1 Tax=Rhabditophanes sp. KR3021 TaxID=114890 RepID=A0AC35UBF4_9BILA
MELASLIEKPRVKNVYLKECGCRNPQEGDLTLVGHHLVFIPNLLNPTSVQNGELWLLYRAVDKVEVSITTKSNKTNDSKVELALLTLKCKNFLILVFQFTDIDDCEAVARAIEKLSNIDDIKLYYSYYYKCPFTVLDDGWLSYNVEEQFAKLLLKSGNKFRISTVNQNYSMCSSYPEKVIVPISNEDINLKISSTYRAEGRFPILAYYHQPKNVPIAISSQPLVGPLWRKCTEDENIVNSYLFGNGFGVIFDTRTKNLATLSRSRGGGVETNQNYSQYKYLHGKVPRIKEIKDSLRKLVALCQENDCGPDRWVRKLNDSGWLQSVSDSITAAATVAQIVDCEGKPVLIHGENGTDSTLLTGIFILLLTFIHNCSFFGRTIARCKFEVNTRISIINRKNLDNGLASKHIY